MWFAQLLIALSAIAGAGWLIRKMLQLRVPEEPAPAEPGDEPYADVPAPRRHGPKGRAAAVAVAEPDEHDDFEAFPPRTN